VSSQGFHLAGAAAKKEWNSLNTELLNFLKKNIINDLLDKQKLS
jgi:hypothetical protein